MCQSWVNWQRASSLRKLAQINRDVYTLVRSMLTEIKVQDTHFIAKQDRDWCLQLGNSSELKFQYIKVDTCHTPQYIFQQLNSFLSAILPFSLSSPISIMHTIQDEEVKTSLMVILFSYMHVMHSLCLTNQRPETGIRLTTTAYLYSFVGSLHSVLWQQTQTHLHHSHQLALQASLIGQNNGCGRQRCMCG